MKIKLNKKKLKNLSKDTQSLPVNMTPQIAGGNTIGHSQGSPFKCVKY
ncbi:hypothetical protein [Pseudoalteromonas denitrificans]|jgi:hypothetical protein|uniref:Uncharacterized protein n=1 Tax=Pseudoalteromonas denitrificans DSM 6059 TaxID=1123010 RepID=A0A1I1Q8C9_9GAMM|nr:hypothetical protein [Pseudoalteromonas denitrificans]SFD18222.1 hypothetical protein SAMN02745724_03774 [Pseudoalteromonas denitrificans DSM 6059]